MKTPVAQPVRAARARERRAQALRHITAGVSALAIAFAIAAESAALFATPANAASPTTAATV
jgi:hypothetical protein